jgi:hypothetical protein
MRALVRLLLAAGLVLAAGRARADGESAKCSARIIHALDEGTGIDPQITLLRPYLEKKPFAAWKHFKLLEEKELTVARSATSRFALPNGRQVALTYLDHFTAEDGDHRMRLRFRLYDGKTEKVATTFVLDEGGLILLAGQRYENGMLVLGFSCKTQN